MTRRILIHALALLLGGGLGLGLGSMADSNGYPPAHVMLIVVGCIFVFQALALTVAERVTRPRPEPVFKEPTVRGNQAWGWLKPLNGLGAGFPLNKDSVRIGRGIEMDIMLNNSSISRCHAELRRMSEGCLVLDIGARNGVFVNGMRITEQLVADGDQLALGELKFQFVVSLGPRAGLSDSEIRREDLEKTSRSTADLQAPQGPRRLAAPDLDPISKTTDLSHLRRGARPFDDTEEYDREDME
jgi:hypothetical protein